MPEKKSKNRLEITGKIFKNELKRYGEFDVCNGTLAYNRKRKGEFVKNYLNFSAFKNLAIEVSKLEKDTKVVLIGRVGQNSWTDKSGGKRTSTNLDIDEFEVMEDSSSSSENSGNEPEQAESAPVENEAEDDVPF